MNNNSSNSSELYVLEMTTTFTILMTIIGYFYYEGINGGLSILGYILILDALSLIFLIPYLIGLLVWAWLVVYVVEPFWFNLTHIYPSPVTAAICAANMVVGLFLNVISTKTIWEIYDNHRHKRA